MPYRGRRVRRGRRAPARKRMGYRKRYAKRNPVHTFTEVVEASAVYSNTGGVWSCNFNTIPQASNYSTLYKQFCIKKLQVICLPNFGAVDPALLTSGQETARLAFAVDDTPSLQVPATELDVITANGAKIVTGTKKIVINCRPKPDVLMNTGKGAALAATRVRGNVWLNTDSADVGNSGTGIEHYGIRYWCSSGPVSISLAQFSVYFKITFSLRDAA